MDFFNEATKHFFAACEKQKLWLQHCPGCQKHIFYLRGFCPECLGPLELVEATGKGKIISYTIVEKNPMDPYFAQITPYIAAIVELAEGVFMYTRIITDETNDIAIGQDVEVIFVKQNGKTVPAFQPVYQAR